MGVVPYHKYCLIHFISAHLIPHHPQLLFVQCVVHMAIKIASTLAHFMHVLNPHDPP